MMVSGNVANMPGLLHQRPVPDHRHGQRDVLRRRSLQRQALFSIGLVLFLFIMLINATLNFFLKRDKEG